MDMIDGLLGRTGPVTFALNHQVIYPEVGFTCNGTIERVVFGAGDIYGQRTERPLLQIWRPVGDTTFMLVSQATLRIFVAIRGLHEYTLPSPIMFEAGDIIGFYQPPQMVSQFRIMLESGRVAIFSVPTSQLELIVFLPTVLWIPKISSASFQCFYCL